MMDVREMVAQLDEVGEGWTLMGVRNDNGPWLVFVNGGKISLRCSVENGAWKALWRDFYTSHHKTAANALKYLRSEIETEANSALRP